MKVYTASNLANDNIEILLSHQELKELVSSLENFESKVRQFKIQNKDGADLGYTHVHLKDCGLTDENNNTDIVFYLNLNE